MQRSRTFDTLANAQESLGDAEGARLARDQAEKSGVSNLASLSWTRRELAQDLLRDNKPAEAERVYEEAVRLALAPGRQAGARGGSDMLYVVITGISLAGSLDRAERPEAARRVLLRARAAAEAEPGFEYGFFVAREQARIGDVVAARVTLDVFQPRINDTADLGRRNYGNGAMIAARWGSGDREAARLLYEKAAAHARSQPVDNSERSNAMNALPTMLASIGDYEAAFRMVDEEIDDQFKGVLFYSVVEAMGRAAGLVDHSNEAWAYPPIDGEAARAALRLAAKVAETSKYDDIRARLGSIVVLQAKLGDLEGARRSYQAIATRGIGGDAAPDAAVLVSLAHAGWKAGVREAAEVDFAAALRVADSLPERGEERLTRWPTSTHPRAMAIAVVVLARAELGDVEGAIEVAARIGEPVEKARALASAAQARADDKDMVGAARLAKATGHGFPSLRVLIGVADAEDHAGDHAGAEATLRFALKEAEDYLEHRPDDPTIPPYNPSMVSTHWDRPPEGRERAIRQQASAAFEVAEIRSKLGDIPGALRALETVADGEWREGALLGIILEQLRAGDAPGAFERAYRLPSPSRRLSALFCLGGAIKSLKTTSGQRPAGP